MPKSNNNASSRESIDDKVFSEFRVIDRKLIELSSKLDYFLNTLNKIEDRLENKYVTREAFEVCNHDLNKLQNNLSWLVRTLVAAGVGLVVFALEFKLFK